MALCVIECLAFERFGVWLPTGWVVWPALYVFFCIISFIPPGNGMDTAIEPIWMRGGFNRPLDGVRNGSSERLCALKLLVQYDDVTTLIASPSHICRGVYPS